MKYCIFLLVVSLALLEIHSHPSISEAENEKEVWKQRRVRQTRLNPSDIEAHIEDKLKKASHKNVVPYGVPKEKSCAGESVMPSYAKAVCTTYPGRVVCQLGRYTFVINNGDHPMEPEVIERFAAMVYHRTQEGDSNFDVAVDRPDKEECYCPENGNVEATTRAQKEAPKAPVYIECTPLKDERKLCNPSFTPSEVIYSCKRKEIGIGKRMVISVDEGGTVREGQLVLPYPSSNEKRLKRQNPENRWRKPPQQNALQVKSFTDICTSSESKWCQSGEGKPLDRCSGDSCMTTIKCLNGPSEGSAPVKSDLNPSVPLVIGDSSKDYARKGTNLNPAVESNPIENPREQDVAKLRDDENKAEFWRGRVPPPVVRDFTDECSAETQTYDYCFQSAAVIITECDTQACVTKEDATPPTMNGKAAAAIRVRREKQTTPVPDKDVMRGPMFRYKKKLLNTRMLGVKKPIAKRRRQATTIASDCIITTTCPTPTTSCGPVPDPPKEVPACLKLSPQPLSCPPPTPEPTKCPTQAKRQRRAPRNRWRRRKKINHEPRKIESSEDIVVEK